MACRFALDCAQLLASAKAPTSFLEICTKVNTAQNEAGVDIILHDE